MTVSCIRGAMTAVLALSAMACAAPGGVQVSPQPQGNPPMRTPVEQARADSARLPYTAADIQFMSGMIGHHGQALTMSALVPTHDASPEIRRLAERIINAQKDEIKTMQVWLKDRNQPVPDPTTMGMKHVMNGQEHVMLMPGMLTEDQMKQLDRARGPDFDKLFLSFMIQHHRGATAMVKELFGSYGAGQDETVFKFASDVNVDQTTEIERMQKMLASLTLGVPVP